MPGSGDAENTSTARTQLWCMELLSSLDRSVFLISPEHYLRAERLLDQIGPLEHFERLRTLIAPIVVTNAQQAERFDEAFYAYQRQLDAYQELMVAEEPPPPKDLLKKNRSGGSSQGDRKSSRTSLNILVPLLVVVLAAVTTFWPIRFPFESKPPGVIVEGKPAVSTRPNPVEQSVAPGDASVPLTRLSPTPFAVDPATWWELQGDRIRAGVFGIPLLLLAILFALHRRRRKLIAERASKATGPIVIKFQAPKPTTGPFGDDELRRTARETRRRQRSATTRLSIARSVRATVESLGFPTLVYEAVTRPPEYVVFIEELSPADHQARYYEALIDRLDAEGAIVTRYRYQRDPRLSFEKERNDQDKRDSVWLGDIFQMHSDARLVLIGDGQGFVDPFTGVLFDWVSMLESWEERAFLTTVVPSRW
ncbi:MAG: hypothetical protein ABJB74_08675, partial [Gemmatimonas sp.]